jgi:predicted MFS family arabinose efflux permease
MVGATQNLGLRRRSNRKQLAMTDSIARPRPEWQIVLLLAAIQFCHILDFVIMMPLGPSLMHDLEISTQQFGFLVSSYSIAAAIVGILMAVVLDHFERRRALFGLFVGFVAATFACSISPNYETLLAARVFAGCFGGVVGACVFAIVGETIPPHRRGRVMGIIMSSFSIASVAGVPIGLEIAKNWGWNAPFLALSALSTAIAALIFGILPKMSSHLKTQTDLQPHGPAHALRELGQTAAWKPHRMAFIMIASLMMSGFFVIPFIAAHLVHNLSLPSDKLPFVYLCGGMGTIFSSQIIGRCADAFGHFRTLLVTTVIAWIPVVVLCNAGPLPTIQILILMTVFMMFVSGRMVPAMALVTAAADPQRRGSFMSLFTSVQAAAMGLAALIGGQIVRELPDGGLAHFNWLGILSVATSLVTLFMATRIASWVRRAGT